MATNNLPLLKEVEAMKIIIPAEEELGQTGYQTLCFLTHAAQADFIAPDAMAKLRQVTYILFYIKMIDIDFIPNFCLIR